MRDALAQRKMAMDEFTDINERLADIRSQKQKLSRQLRDREEEIEEQRQKLESQRQDIRKSEKSKRELQSLLEESQSEASKERKLKDWSEQFSKELEAELDSLKQRQLGRSPSTTNLETSQEIARYGVNYHSSSLSWHKQ